jgi:hypothetical protein
MKHAFAIVFFLFIASCKTDSKKGDIVKNKDTYSIDTTNKPVEDSIILFTRNSLGKFKIGGSVKELKKIYSDCEFINDETNSYGLDGGFPTYLVKRKNEKLFLFFLGDPGKDAITGFLILSSKYKSENGLKVGMTIREVKKLFPNCSLVYDDWNSIEYIEVDEFKHYIAVESSTNNQLVGNYKKGNSSTKNMKLDAKIKWIFPKTSL